MSPFIVLRATGLIGLPAALLLGASSGPGIGATPAPPPPPPASAAAHVPGGSPAPEGWGARKASAPREDRFQVYLITVDQGDEIWEMFGHNALVVLDRERDTATAWNWGIFDFQDVDFIPRFLRGTMRYRMEGMDPEWMIQAYIRSNRSVHSHEVLLTQDEARRLHEHLLWHNLPENRHYTYDYFRDNCSTRIRDALDLALDGALWDRFRDRVTPESYRWHSRRLVQVVGWVDQGLSFLLGTRGDVPRTEWEAMFIPMEMARILEAFEPERADGSSGTLLGPRQVLFEADRPPTPAEAPPFSIWMPLLGVLGAGLLILLGWRAAGEGGERRGATGDRIAFGAAVGAWTLFSGILGWLLVSSWFTDHIFIHRNLNLFYASPLAPLVLALLIPALTSGARGRWGRGAAGAALLVAALSLAMALVQAVGLLTQGNGEVIALALPMNLALALAMVRVYRGAPRPSRATRATASTTRSTSAITL